MLSSSAYQTRRAPNSSEETTETTVSSSESLIASEYCRMGFPAPLPPFGVRHYPLDKDALPIAEKLREAAAAIVNARDIKWEALAVVQRRASGATLDKRPTLVITASEANDDGWYLALKDVQEFLSTNNSLYISVEIVDQAALKLPAHFPVEQAHPIVSAWRQLRKSIVTIVRDTPWSSISVARRGYDDEAENNPVTIIITSSSPGQLSHLRSTIHYRCRDFGLSGVQTAFVHVASIWGAGGFHYPKEGKPISLANDLYPGAGIGPADHATATGTLGGRLTVSVGDEEKCVAVSNFLVVRPDVFTKDFEPQGFRPTDASTSRYTAVSPSNFDTQCYSKELNDDASATEERVRDYRSKYAVELDFDESKRATLRKLEENAQVLGDERQKLGSLERNVGPIWAASGHRVRNGFGMDWALVSLANRKLINKLPTEQELSALSGSLARMVGFPPSGQIEEFGEIEKASVCLKKGRTTGLTRGRCTNLEPYVRFKGRTVEAWHVVGTFNSPFCENGDSGSWIIDEFGRVVGLLFSCPFASYSGDGFVIPIREVVADIEDLTGGKVSLPGTTQAEVPC